MKWSNKENDLLERLWKRPDLTFHEIAEVFPDRTSTAVSKHASEMGLKKEMNSRIDTNKLGEMELFEI